LRPTTARSQARAQEAAMSATLDRGEIIHHAGRHGLAPALAEGAPALLAHGEPGRRVGWAPFFSALDRRGEALDLASDGAVRTVPRAGGPSPSGRPSAAAGFLALAAATLRSLAARGGPRP